MKKLVLAALAATVFAAPAFAQGKPTAGNDFDSATTTISGAIPLSCTIEAPEGSNILDLTDNGAQSIGDVNVACNSVAGYTVSAASANAGKLAAEDSATTFAYEIGAYGSFVSLAQGASLPVQGANSGQIAQNVALDVKVGQRVGAAYAGVYADTITLSVQSN